MKFECARQNTLNIEVKNTAEINKRIPASSSRQRVSQTIKNAVIKVITAFFMVRLINYAGTAELRILNAP